MDSREQFENHPRFKGMDFTRSATHPMYYESPYANGAWDGWQAANRDFSGLEARASINLIDPYAYASPEVAASVISDCLEAIKYAGSKV